MFPSPCCGKLSRVYETKAGKFRETEIVIKRKRQCLSCGKAWETTEIRSSNPFDRPTIARADREVERENEQLAEAMAAGRPKVTGPCPCPHCGSTFKVTKGGPKTGRIGGDYWRQWHCRICNKRFYTATDLVTGVSTVHRRGLSDHEIRERMKVRIENKVSPE